ncbi:ribonuclease H family protein [Oceaniradius stylonematis]|uniref:ribonuclease H family protein n=1 Tax=Oceaniradius stylonematis TaxID=2184161 RepID=UPI00273E291F|nr:ribonuclease H [Oceaniradius stylonematis]
MIHIYTDGACEPNPGYGGWAFVVYEKGLEITNRNGGSENSTNNIMEMTAVLEALRYAKDAGLSAAEVIIHTDSQYVCKGCTIWRHSWKKKGWKRGPEKPLKNAELWQAIAEAHDAFPCKIVWVRGHSGVPGNERADQLADKGRRYFLPAHMVAA